MTGERGAGPAMSAAARVRPMTGAGVSATAPATGRGPVIVGRLVIGRGPVIVGRMVIGRGPVIVGRLVIGRGPVIVGRLVIGRGPVIVVG